MKNPDYAALRRLLAEPAHKDASNEWRTYREDNRRAAWMLCYQMVLHQLGVTHRPEEPVLNTESIVLYAQRRGSTIFCHSDYEAICAAIGQLPPSQFMFGFFALELLTLPQLNAFDHWLQDRRKIDMGAEPYAAAAEQLECQLHHRIHLLQQQPREARRVSLFCCVLDIARRRT